MKPLKILVGCEMSGELRRAFRARGHDAFSCDILPSQDNSPYHLQCDVMSILDQDWDVGVFFPSCTDLARSVARWFPEKIAYGRQARVLQFVKDLWDCGIPKVAIENPVGILSTQFRTPDQIVHPWWFGDAFEKQTCIWLRGGLPLLQKTNPVKPPPRTILSSGKSLPAWYNLSPGPNRAMLRSLTFPGVAKAMADAWSPDLTQGVP